MKVTFTKISDQRHVVLVERTDDTNESVDLDSRSFLRHDLAHFAVELELGLASGVWGSELTWPEDPDHIVEPS